MKATSAIADAAPQNWQNVGFGIYVHWPFCAAKCPYCDFNSHVTAAIDQEKWAQAYVSELRREAARTPGRILSTVFFGGGTPSLMAAETVATILDEIRRLWPMVNDPEITLEANPTSVEAGRFQGYRAAGVNRVSLGVQALNDTDLKRLGRLHTAAEARAAFEIARTVFDRVSFDLIYARQDQTADQWCQELNRALDMAADHLSLYQLTIEPDTAFGERHARGGLQGLPPDDLSADMYEMTQEICNVAGLPAYEISNHARPGAESRHNLIYWRGGDWIGVGPGAHGRLTLAGQRFETEAIRAPAPWLDAVSQHGTGTSAEQAVEPEDQAAEYLMMGLRLNEGIDLERFAALGGAFSRAKLTDMAELGLIEATGKSLRATDKGQILLNSVLAELLAV